MRGWNGAWRQFWWPRLVALSVLCFLGTSTAASEESVPSENCWPYVDRAIELLDIGEPWEAISSLEAAKGSCGKRLVGLSVTLMRAYARYRESLPNEAIASREARRLLDRVAPPSKFDEIPDSSLHEVVARIRRHLGQHGQRPSGSLLRPFLCSMRLLARDTATDGEPVIDDRNHRARPTRVFSPAPSFFDPLSRRTIEGFYVVKLVVDSEGCPGSATILKGVSDRLDRVVVPVVRWWAYEPATLEGEPVAVSQNVTFRLSKF